MQIFMHDEAVDFKSRFSTIKRFVNPSVPLETKGVESSKRGRFESLSAWSSVAIHKPCES